MFLDGSYAARIDLANSNSPQINPVNNNQSDPVTIQFNSVQVEDSNGNQVNGDQVLETNGGLADPDTVVLINEVPYPVIYEFSANFTSAAGDLAGVKVVLITVVGYPETGENTRLFFTPDRETTGQELEALGNGTIPTTPTNTDPVCYVAGTLIDTPQGPVAVENLRAGDLVITVDASPQPLVWVSSSLHVWQ